MDCTLPKKNFCPKTLDKTFFDNLPTNVKQIGKNKTYFIKTYGCLANVRDSQLIKGILNNLGFKEVNDWHNASLVILNTCAIRQNAENKVLYLLKSLSSLKRKKNKNLVFGICGCIAQQKNILHNIFDNIDNINFVFGVHNLYQLPVILQDVFINKAKSIKILNKFTLDQNSLSNYQDSKYKALVNIMYGCNHFCTYCIVPYVRGSIISRPKQIILNEVLSLKKAGYKDIILLGQNVNSYGIDLYPDYHFNNLLEDVAKIGIDRIRFSTSNPWNFNYEIIHVMQKYKNLMPYIHLPIQSGSSKILEKMGRKTNLKQYIKLIKYARKNIPNLVVSTDFIVGFPNETWCDFKKTLKLYKKVKFDNAYTFIYSKRPNTPASKISDKISYKVKQKRLFKLNKLVKKYAKLNNEKYVGQVVQVLVDGFSKTNKKVLTGYSFNWKVVNFLGTASPGQIVNVKITNSSQFSLNGKQV